MNNTYFGARLVNDKTISVAIFSNYQKPSGDPIRLMCGDNKIIKLNIFHQSFLNGLVIYECHLDEPLELGHPYSILIKNFGITPLVVDGAADFAGFDEKYFYDGDDLGCTYESTQSTFKIWAPLASKVTLFIRKEKEDNFDTYIMKRDEKGLYSITLKGNYEGYKYRFRTKNNGLSRIGLDPYGKASTANGKDSVVIDPSKINIDLNNSKLTYPLNYVDAIIYEISVRDFTSHPSSNIKNKGKYLGLIEEGKVSLKGNPVGIDYLKKIGITHVQLMPVSDFKTIDELNPSSSYNWGYDPSQYFTPEGSYATDPNDPYSRIIELKKMIAKLHENNIKVNMDVVFNHVYDEQFSTFDKVVPNYYFRKKKDGTLSNGSGCGNDLDTARRMVRKLIIDCLVYWVKEYGIDGFRFDLMGIIDIETMKEVTDTLKKINPSIMLYGEGWDMPTELGSAEKTTIYNSFKVPSIGFFNDSFRDIVRGSNFGYNAGYCLGNIDFLEGFKYAFLATTTDYCYNARFINANQSINYCECHDNQTLYDRIQTTFSDCKEEDILLMIKLINSVIAFSNGVTFYHQGQEIGLSKFGSDNSYNLGDRYNWFDFDIMDKRIEMVDYFSSVNHFKNEVLNCSYFKKSDLEKLAEFKNLDNGGVLIKLKNLRGKIKEMLIAINPTNKDYSLTLDDYYRVILTKAGATLKSDLYLQNIILDAHAINVFTKEKQKGDE